MRARDGWTRIGPVAVLAKMAVSACSTGDTQRVTQPASRTAPALDPLVGESLRDTGPSAVSLRQVVAGAREQVPSALRQPEAAGLPPPLVDLARASSTWNALGTAFAGPLAGERLTPATHVSTFWFAWSSFHEDTRVER